MHGAQEVSDAAQVMVRGGALEEKSAESGRRKMQVISRQALGRWRAFITGVCREVGQNQGGVSVGIPAGVVHPRAGPGMIGLAPHDALPEPLPMPLGVDIGLRVLKRIWEQPSWHVVP